MNAKSTPKVRRIPNAKPDPKEAARKTAIAKAAEEAAKKARAKEAEKEAAKKAKEQEQAAALAKAEAKLEPIAKEINVRLEKAAMMDGKADDHRLAAALKFAEAKKLCESTPGLKFEEWSKKHVPNQSFETVRQLARIGAAEKPELALADLRKSNAERNKAHRAKTKKAGKSGAGDLPSAPSRSAATPFQRAEAALSELPESVVKELVTSQAGQLGFQVVSDKELKDLRQIKSGATSASKDGDGLALTVDEIVGAFKKLKAGDRIKVLDHMERITGYHMVSDDDFKLIAAGRKAQAAKKPAE